MATTPPLIGWIDDHINAAAKTVDRLLPRIQSFVKGADIPDLVPDDLAVHDFGMVHSDETGSAVKYLWYQVTEKEGGKVYDEYRVINLLRLHAIPLNARGETGAVDKMRKILRGLANAGTDIVYLVAGIFRPVQLGIVQCYGVVAHDRDREKAVTNAMRGAATLEAAMAAGYPQIRFRPLDQDMGHWIKEALQNMPYGILSVGQPDPRETSRGMASDVNPLLNTSKGRQSQYTLQQNEIVMRGMAQLQEEFLLQVLLTPVSMADASRILHGLMEYTSTVAAWQTGTRSFNLGVSLPILFSGALVRNTGLGYTELAGHGVSSGTSHVDSQAHTEGAAHTHTEGVAVTDGLSTTHAEGSSRTNAHTESGSVTDGASQETSASETASVSANAGISAIVASAGGSMSYGGSVGESQGASHSVSSGVSDMTSQANSVQDSVTRSHAVTSSQSNADTVSQADSVGSADGVNNSVSDQTGTALARGISQGLSEGISYGLAPSVSVGEANQWQNDPAILLTQILRQQQMLLSQMTLEQGFYADVYALTRTERGKQAMLTLIPEAFHGTEDVVMGVQTRTLLPEEEAYIRLHAKAMTPSTRECRMAEAVTGYMDSTLVTAEQAAAYMTPGLMEEGTARTVQEAIPPFAFDPTLPGDVVIGHQWSSERGEPTSTPLRLTQERHFHSAFVADTGFGKSVAAERLAYETTLKWHYRTIVLDFGQGWRKALNWPGLTYRVDIRQLYPGAVRPIRWNPLQIPRRTPVYRYRNMLVELFANAGRMGPRQLGFMRDALTNVYKDCGVIVEGRNTAEFGIVRDSEEEAAINAALLEYGERSISCLNYTITSLSTFERQALLVYRSRAAGIDRWVDELRSFKDKAEKARDQNSRSSLEGALLRLEPLAEGELLEMYGPGYDTIAIEDLGLLGPAGDHWGMAVIEGGAQMDEFAKSALLSLIAAVLYEDAVVRRRESLDGQRFPPLQIFFEEANKVLTGVDTGSSTSDKDSPGGNQTSQIFTVMWRDGRKYKTFLHILAQTISEIPDGILSSCNNGFFGQTKHDRDRQAALAHLARNTKGFVNSEYDRFLARMTIGMFIAKLGYTSEITQTEPYLITPDFLAATEPSDGQIAAYYERPDVHAAMIKL